MITLVLPGVFGMAIAGAMAITAWHFLSVRRPPELIFPTARFLPDRTVRAVSRTKRPSDVWLLLVRIAVLLSAGLAAAGPGWRGRSATHMVLIVSDHGVARDTIALRALVTRAHNGGPADTRVAYAFADDRGNVQADAGALFPVAWRAAARAAATDVAIDSFALHVVLSRAPDVGDAGLVAWRDAWPGRVTMHQPVGTSGLSRHAVVVLERAGTIAGDDDVVRSAFTWHAARRSGSVASDPLASRVRVFWPVNGVPAGWRAVPAGDSASALATGGQALMGPWPVTALPDSSADVRPIAWWSDGRVAATERPTPTGCDRLVAVVSAWSSDALLSSSANVFFDRLMSPCGRESPVLASALTVERVHGSSLAASTHFREGNVSWSRGRASWIAPSLYAVALLLLLLEGRLRNRMVAVSA